MFCRRCGKYNIQGSKKCRYCGSEDLSVFNPNPSQKTGYSKNGLGVFLGLFFGLIGLIIGLCAFPYGTTERNTFVSGWAKGFIADFIIAILLLAIIRCNLGLCG